MKFILLNRMKWACFSTLKSLIFYLVFTALFIQTVKAQPIIYQETFDLDTAKGVSGNAKIFDGYFTEHVVEGNIVKEPAEGFTIQAWVAPQEYATNISAILDREKEMSSGYLLGIDNHGKLVAGIAVNGKWISCTSEQPLPLLKWSHIVMTYKSGSGVVLYVNGNKAGENVFSARADLCADCKISIGKTQTKLPATNTERETSRAIVNYGRFDGLIDEIKVFGVTLGAAEVFMLFSVITPKNPQPLTFRKMPSGTDERKPFGAYYTRLSYSPGWDKLWHGSDLSDVVVKFENSPVKFVFWRGTGYIPGIVSENGIWSTEQSIENYGTGECYEAMGDKQARYSHVRIIENTPARTVIHWRYALAGIKHNILHEDENGWGDWADEYWTIYPDGVAARKQVLWTDHWEKEKRVFQFQETIFFNQPGTKPQDNVDMDTLTFLDENGVKATYSWRNGPPKKFETPAFQPIQLVNFKSQYKPFSIFSPERICKPFSFGNRKEYTTFPNWNHWPVQQVLSDGRNAVAPDKPSHASLTDSNGSMQVIEKGGDNSYYTASLLGMTNKNIESLLPLSKSWNHAPAIRTISKGFKFKGYDKYQRAYLIDASDALSSTLTFTISATEASPVHNLALVIDNWKAEDIDLMAAGRKLQKGKDYSLGYLPGLELSKTVLFVYLSSISTADFIIKRNR